MGQRLVIQNQINGESVNVIYYHWSAYTESAIEELKEFANRLSVNYKNQSDSLFAMLTNAGRELFSELPEWDVRLAQSDKIQVGARMDDDEPLITEYNLTEYLNKNYKGSDLVNQRAFARPKTTRGFVKRTTRAKR